MSVAEAVRERLAVLDEIDLMHEHDRIRRATIALREALLGVLDIHQPRPPTSVEAAGLPAYEAAKHVCTTCATSAGWLGDREVYPCRTVRAMMDAIGAKETP